MTWPLGQPVRLTFATFSDVGETVPADPTTLTLVVTRPDGTAEQLTWAGGGITRDSLGVFHKDYTGASAGTYLFRWAAAGAVQSVETGQFEVRAHARRIVSLAEAKEHVGIPEDDASHDAELGDALTAIERLLARKGYTLAAERTDDFRPSGETLILAHPLVSVDSVTAYSGGVATVYELDDPTAATPSYAYEVAMGAGLLTFLGGWPRGSLVRVVYTSGYDADDLRWPVKEQLRLWFEEAKGVGSQTFGEIVSVATRNPRAGLHPWVESMLPARPVGVA